MDEADVVVENSLKEDEYRKKEFALRVARMEQGDHVGKIVLEGFN